MSIEQFGAVLGIVAAAFVLYRLLVQQKDAQIAALKEQIALLERKIKELETQSPDALAATLTKRIETALGEVQRLEADRDSHSSELSTKRQELESLRTQLTSLTDLIRNSDFLCPHCGAPLLRRESITMYGYVGDKEVDAEVEYREYECGYSENEKTGESTPCSRTGAS